MSIRFPSALLRPGGPRPKSGAAKASYELGASPSLRVQWHHIAKASHRSLLEQAPVLLHDVPLTSRRRLRYDRFQIVVARIVPGGFVYTWGYLNSGS
jgi:hypothetical protein